MRFCMSVLRAMPAATVAWMLHSLFSSSDGVSDGGALSKLGIEVSEWSIMAAWPIMRSPSESETTRWRSGTTSSGSCGAPGAVTSLRIVRLRSTWRSSESRSVARSKWTCSSDALFEKCCSDVDTSRSSSSRLRMRSTYARSISSMSVCSALLLFRALSSSCCSSVICIWSWPTSPPAL